MLSFGAVSLVSATPLFDAGEVVDIELIGPLQTLIDAKQERMELPFVLRADGVDHAIDVRVRGKSRIRLCEFPPLRLDFDIGATHQTLFDGQDKLKLVTHCRNSDSGEINVLEEYAAYRIFALLSDVAYRVRLLRIGYTDTDQGPSHGIHHRYGFVIEPQDLLADRVGGVPKQLSGVALSWLNQDQAAVVYVFQHLIGNTDWSLVLADGDDACCHNGDLIDIDDDIYYVPYDFDLAGIVNAAYAKPDPSTGLRNVRSRKYRGFCTNTDTLLKSIRRINSLEMDIFALIRDIPGFSEKDADQTIKYLTKFFEKARKEEKLLRSYERQCID
jgi:hypothetical protein